MSYATENVTENSHICGSCDRSFCTKRGLSLHQRTYQTRNNTYTDSKDAQEVLNVESSSQKITILRNISPPSSKKQCFGRKIFLLLSGKAGRKLIDEVYRLMNEWL